MTTTIRTTQVTLGDGQWGLGTVWGGPSGDAGVYPIASPFGPREPFIAGGQQTSGFHQGLDIAYPEGVPLVAMFDAEVTHVSIDNPIYGNFVIMSPYGADVDDDGWAAVWYGHMSEVYVQSGQRVASGELVGRVGSTGMAAGAHLHLEIRNRWGVTDPFNVLMSGRIGQNASEPAEVPAADASGLNRLDGESAGRALRDAENALAAALAGIAAARAALVEMHKRNGGDGDLIRGL